MSSLSTCRKLWLEQGHLHVKEIHQHSTLFYYVLPYFRRLTVRLVSVLMLRAPPGAVFTEEWRSAGLVKRTGLGLHPAFPARSLHGLEETKNLPEEAPSYLNQGAPTLLPRCLSAEGHPCQRLRRGFDPSVRKIPWKRKWKPTPVFLPGKFHWQEEPGGLRSMES